MQILPYCGENISLFMSPADPTSRAPSFYPRSSYAANAQVFVGEPNIVTTFRDGTSNTITFAEHYSVCGGAEFCPGYPINNLGGERRATFADPPSFTDYGDFFPVTSGNPPVSSSSNNDPADMQITFQVAPRMKDCNPFYAQTPHPSGMLIALADGSVRTLAPGVSPATYWALITPAGGETLGSDW